MSEVIVSPSILSADFANLERDITIVEEAGADWLHIDVMDGHFVPNITIGVPVVTSIKKVTNLPLDVHLMIENPDKYVEPFAKAGADILTFHYEAVEKSKILDVVNHIKSYGLKAGLSIKPKTKPEEIFEFLPFVDMVLVMTVEPGFGGQSFMEECAEKLAVLREKAPALLLQVDGGINEKTGRVCTELGANSLVAGNYIYKSCDVKLAITSLR